MATPTDHILQGLKTLRARNNNPTQARIAEQAGLSEPTVSSVLRGKGSEAATRTVWSALGGTNEQFRAAIAGRDPFAEEDDGSGQDQDPAPVDEPDAAGQDDNDRPAEKETAAVIVRPAPAEVLPATRVPQVLVPQEGDTLILGNAGSLSRDAKAGVATALQASGVHLLMIKAGVELDGL